MMVHTWNPTSEEGGVGKSKFQGHLCKIYELKASLDYMLRL